MSRRSSHLAPLAVACVCLAMPLAHGAALQPARPASTTPNDDSRFMNVSFPGGTMSAYFDTLRAAAQTPINAVMSPDVAKAMLGPIELKRVSLNTAVRAIEWAAVDSNAKFASTPILDGLEPGQQPATSTFLIQSVGMPGVGYQGPIFPPTPAVRVIGIRDLLVAPTDIPDAKVYSTKDIVDSLDGAIRFAVSDRAEPKVAVHEASGLILIQGSADHAAIAETYVKQLRAEQQSAHASARKQRVAFEQAARRTERIEKTLAEASQIESVAQSDLNADRAELERLLADANRTPEKQAAVARLTSRIARAESSLRWATSLLERARSEKFNPPSENSEVIELRQRIEELASQLQALESRIPQSRGSGK